MDLFWPVNTPLDRGGICGSQCWPRWSYLQCRRVGTSDCLKKIVYDSCLEQAIWTGMYLNGGVDPNTNTTIIPPAEFDVITSAHSISNPNATAQTSTELYGLGWSRLSILGHDVSKSFLFYPARDIILANRSFYTAEVIRGCPHSSLLLSRMVSE